MFKSADELSGQYLIKKLNINSNVDGVSSQSRPNLLLNLSQKTVNLNNQFFKKPSICLKQHENGKILNEINSESLRTTRDLRDSIISFRDKESGCSRLSKKLTANKPAAATTTQTDEVFSLERERTLAAFCSFRENHFISRKKKSSLTSLWPGHTAKRYLSNWSKFWNPDLLDVLYKDSALIQENFYEPSKIEPNSKRRISDDISRVPAKHRIEKDLNCSLDIFRGIEETLEKIKVKGDEDLRLDVDQAFNIVSYANYLEVSKVSFRRS